MPSSTTTMVGFPSSGPAFSSLASSRSSQAAGTSSRTRTTGYSSNETDFPEAMQPVPAKAPAVTATQSPSASATSSTAAKQGAFTAYQPEMGNMLPHDEPELTRTSMNMVEPMSTFVPFEPELGNMLP
jgi:hypothetical protein